MFIPIGFDQTTSGVPLSTWLLLLLNVGIYLQGLPYEQTLVAPDDPVAWQVAERLSQQYGQSSPQEIVENMLQKDLWFHQWGFLAHQPTLSSALTYQFLHGGLWHVLSNCWFLWLFGPFVEAVLGSFRFVMAYLVVGIVAALGHMLLDGHSMVPLIGASGSIAGIMGAVFVWYPRLQVKILVLWLLWRTVVWYPVRSVLAFVMLLQNLLPMIMPWLLETSSTSPIAYSAHLAGFLCGALAAWRYGAVGMAQGSALEGAEALFQTADRLYGRYQTLEAQQALEQLLRRYPQSSKVPQAALALALLRWHRFNDREGARAALLLAHRKDAPEEIRQQAARLWSQLYPLDGVHR